MAEPFDPSPDVELTEELAREAAAAAGATNPAAFEERPARRSLWHHSNYMKVWTAATISLMGSQISQFAIPFIAATFLHATPLEVALLGAVDMLPFILFTLPAGAWLDRILRRPVLIVGDLGRALALATIPLAFAAGVLTIWQLYAVGFTTGVLTVFFDVADQSYLPVLLKSEELVEGNAKLQISGSTAQITGPGIAGSLVGIVAAPFAIALDAASFVISGALISLIRKRETKPERRLTSEGVPTSIRQEIAEGLRYVLGNRYLRMIAGSTGTSNFGSSMCFSIFPVFAYVELGLPATLIGVSLSIGALGTLLGAFAAEPLARRFGVGPMIVASMFVNGPSLLLLAFLPSFAPVAGALMIGTQFGSGFSAVVYNVNQVSFRQAITPLDMQGRMNATMRFIVWGIMPIGALTGGLVGSFLPLRTTVLIGALISMTAFLWILLSPVRSLRTIPTNREAAAD